MAQEGGCTPAAGSLAPTLGKADDLPLAPGEMAEIRITLLPISVRIGKGRRIRVAIAGHDAALKTRYPQQGPPAAPDPAERCACLLSAVAGDRCNASVKRT